MVWFYFAPITNSILMNFILFRSLNLYTDLQKKLIKTKNRKTTTVITFIKNKNSLCASSEPINQYSLARMKPFNVNSSVIAYPKSI